MGKFNVTAMRYLDAEHFRVLLSVEMGMKNHEMVPLPLISSIANIHRGATARILRDLTKINVVVYENGKRYDGFRLTNLGYDFLALRALCSREVVGAVGNQIGVGKESDVYVGGDSTLKDIALKFHRLGRTSFRKIKEKRDYHKKRHFCSWLYLARIAAIKEFSFLKALHSRNFPVPKPIDVCRHTVVMQLIDGLTLNQVDSLSNVEALMGKLFSMIVRLGKYGLIHGDFNEFNIMLLPDEEPIMIDFPQMVSIDHPNAEFYFNRDVECIARFFRRKFDFDCNELPKFADVDRKYNLDVELEASGFTKRMALDLNKAYDEGNFAAHLDGDSSEQEDGSDDLDDEEHEGDEYDEEEMTQIAEDSQAENKRLAKSSLFNTWLENARTELENATINDEECPELVEMDEQTLLRYQETIKNTEVKIRELEATHVEDVDDPDDEVAENVDGIPSKRSKKHQSEQRGKVTDQRSVYSFGSTIAPEEIRRRLFKDRQKTKKEKLRVKGKQCAVRRGRKENIDLMKEYAGWDKY